jgi:predicted site-specific integrase-resolvase
MTPEEAIAVAGISRGTLSDWMSAGRGHYVEANTVVLLICLESIDGVKDKDWKGVR